jgi:N-acetylglucosamine-6-phosphate deacetylase
MNNRHPGYIDLQVNGYQGINFSDSDLQAKDIAEVSKILGERGVSQYFPTLITSPWEVYERVLPLLGEFTSNHHKKGYAQITGIHLEGPFISPIDGARGIHPKPFIRIPLVKEFDVLYELSQAQIRFLTLSPELPGAMELIYHARQLGVHVSIGHTLADSQTIRRAVEAGAAFSTHLGNGLPINIHRHQNPLWEQLINPGLTPLLIADGHHLPEEFVRLVLQVKGADNVIIASDSSPIAGLKPGCYDFFGTSAILEENGRLYEPSSGLLAGSSACMRDCDLWLEEIGFSDTERNQVCRSNALRLVFGCS